GRALRQPPDRLRPRQSRFRAFRRELRRHRRTRHGPRCAARGLAARLCPPRRPDTDRSAGRPDALAVGVHPHAEGARAVAWHRQRFGRASMLVIRGAPGAECSDAELPPRRFEATLTERSHQRRRETMRRFVYAVVLLGTAATAAGAQDAIPDLKGTW